ncbi:MAG: hypothetical protein V8R55_01735 [Dysosmobacter sp.]
MRMLPPWGIWSGTFSASAPYDGPADCIRVREADNVFSEVEQTAADIRACWRRGRAAAGISR